MADTDVRRRTVVTQAFRPRARVLQLLGDELIGSPRLAVFELVKNAYDADASEVEVRLDLTQPDEPKITVTDDGEGMSLDVLRSVWLVPGDEHRRRQRRNNERSGKHHRLPLGEKGLGRFAVHKLGNRITLTTRARDSDECVVDIDWNALTERPFLDEAPVSILTREPEMFTGAQTGTCIEVRDLRPPEWTRREVRSVSTQITSICSPFERAGEFRAVLRVPGREHWIEDLPDFAAILERATWAFRFSLKGADLDYKYEFRPPPGFSLDPRAVTEAGDPLQLPSDPDNGRMDGKVVADAATTEGIGPVTGVFYVFDRDREVLRRLGHTRLMTDYLDQHGGVRIYRDGIRVYNYGEPSDDWLGLDRRQLPAATRRIGRNVVLGAVDLSLADSGALREKTNREGFIDNEASARLRQVVLGALGTLEAERRIDYEKIRLVTEQPGYSLTSRNGNPIDELKQTLARDGLADRFRPYVTKVETHLHDERETLLTAGMSGLSLAVAFHEIDHGVRSLSHRIVHGGDSDVVRQAQDLTSVLDSFETLLRRHSQQVHDVRRLVTLVRQFNLVRFRLHHVRFDSPLLNGNEGFKSRFSFGLVLGALNNLIDNSLYWLRVRWPESPAESNGGLRRMFVDASRELEGGPAIVVADNGVGFRDDPEHLARPFFTRKPDGMGLGLYYSNLAMEMNEGRLAFPQPHEVGVPAEYDGAVVAMIFKEAG